MIEVVKFERRDMIATITINYPPVNALSAVVRRGIVDHMSAAIADPEVNAMF